MFYEWICMRTIYNWFDIEFVALIWRFFTTRVLVWRVFSLENIRPDKATRFFVVFQFDRVKMIIRNESVRDSEIGKQHSVFLQMCFYAHKKPLVHLIAVFRMKSGYRCLWSSKHFNSRSFLEIPMIWGRKNQRNKGYWFFFYSQRRNFWK